MAVSEFNFSKVWTSHEDFPALENSEDQARADLQALHDETKNKINEIIGTLNGISSGETEISSPTFVGTPKAPTAAAGTSTTQIATTAFVQAAVSSFTSDIFYAGASAPANTKLLWIDTNATTGGLKYHNGSAWVHVPVAYT